MVPLLAGIACLLIAWLVAVPYVLSVILWIAGVLLVIYGVYVLIVGTRADSTGIRGRRYWY